MLSSSGAELAASSFTPVSMYSSSPVSRSMTMIAPCRFPARLSEASATVSTTPSYSPRPDPRHHHHDHGAAHHGHRRRALQQQQRQVDQDRQAQDIDDARRLEPA